MDPAKSERRRIHPLLRWAGFAVLLAILGFFVVAFAWITGCWPNWLEVTVEGPSGWRLVRVAEDEVDEPLPARASKNLGFSWDVRDRRIIETRLEIANGDSRAQCRVRSWNYGDLKSDYAVWLHSVESLDGSLWLFDDWRAAVAYPVVPEHMWFGSNAWGKLRIDGVLSESRRHHVRSIRADEAWHEVVSKDWVLRFQAPSGTAIHVDESGEHPGTTLNLDDAGFSLGTLSIGRSAPESPLDLDEPMTLEGRIRQLEVRLIGSDSAEVRLRLERFTNAALTLRVSR